MYLIGKYLTTIFHNQAGLRKLADNQLGEGAATEIMGDKGTYARRLNELADAYNTDENGVLFETVKK